MNNEVEALKATLDYQETEIEELRGQQLITWFCIIINSLGLYFISHR